MEQIVCTNLYIFHVLSYWYIKLYLIQPLTYPFYPPYVSTLSPQSLWITAEKVDKSVKKGFSHQEVGKSSEKRGFYIALPKKMFTLHYAILCTTMDLSGSSLHTLCTYRIYSSTISLLYFLCNDFSNFYYLLSQLFWFFKCYFLLYVYILWFYILLSLRCLGSVFLYMAVFFPLFFCSFVFTKI